MKDKIMELKDIQKDLEKILSPKRFRHSRGVAETARHLAEKYGADSRKAYVAGWVHDCAKELSLADMQHIVKDAGLRPIHTFFPAVLSSMVLPEVFWLRQSTV